MAVSPPMMLQKVAEANFPSRFGHFRIFGFEARNGARTEEAVVLRMGDVTGEPPPLVRIHSQCLTGDVFHSLRCDCLQDHGADTVEANELLGFDADLRDYELPAQVLRHFAVHAVRLISNNPDKIRALEHAGITVAERVPCQVACAATASSAWGIYWKASNPKFLTQF